MKVLIMQGTLDVNNANSNWPPSGASIIWIDRKSGTWRHIGLIVMLCSIFLATSQKVWAWDAGTESRKHKDGSGGEDSISIFDTRPYWARSTGLTNSGRVADCPEGYRNDGAWCMRDARTYSAPSVLANCPSGYTNMGLDCQRGWNPLDRRPVSSCPRGYFMGAASRCYRTCRAGYTNNGEFCGRGASSKGISSMTCRSNEERVPTSVTGIPRCYAKPVCPAGYDYWGWRCYVSTPPGVRRTAVSTVVHDVKRGGNTHLWIVDRALDLLNSSGLPDAAKIVAKLREPALRIQWENGLWDGDVEPYVDFPNARGTHFYNGAKRNRRGGPTNVVTYTPGGPNKQPCNNARECAQFHINNLSLQALSGEDKANVAYHLGLALHYMTDLTQPMHTSGWSGLSIPTNGHPQWEYYVPFVQKQFPATTFDNRWLNLPSADLVLHEVAVRSNRYAPRLAEVLHIDGLSGICTIQGFNGIGPYTGYCFYNDPDVDALTGEILRDAYQSTASYLYAALKP